MIDLRHTAGVPYNGFVSAGNYAYIGGPGLFHLAQGATSVASIQVCNARHGESPFGNHHCTLFHEVMTFAKPVALLWTASSR